MITRSAALAASITCALALSACGSSDSGGGDAGSKDPIKLMVMGPVEAPQFSLAGIPIGAQQAVDDINADGGVNGRKLELTVCNDKNDPNTGGQCVRQAIKDKTAALVGGFSLFDTQLAPLLDRAGIPWIGGINANDFSSKNLFYSSSDAGAGWVGLGQAMAAEGCKNLGIVTSATATEAPELQMKAGAEASDIKVAGVFAAPANSADWAPTAAAVKSSGADCIASGTGPTESTGLVTAMRAAVPDVKMGFSSGGLPTPLIAQMGDAANGIVEIAGYFPWSSELGDVPTLRKALLAKDAKASLDTFAISGYASVKIFAEVAKGLDGDVTAATVSKALPKLTGFDTGVGPVVSFDKPGPKGFERQFAPQVFRLKVVDGSLDLTDETPLDATAGLELVSTK